MIYERLNPGSLARTREGNVYAFTKQIQNYEDSRVPSSWGGTAMVVMSSDIFFVIKTNALTDDQVQGEQFVEILLHGQFVVVKERDIMPIFCDLND